MISSSFRFNQQGVIIQQVDVLITARIARTECNILLQVADKGRTEVPRYNYPLRDIHSKDEFWTNLELDFSKSMNEAKFVSFERLTKHATYMHWVGFKFTVGLRV